MILSKNGGLKKIQELAYVTKVCFFALKLSKIYKIWKFELFLRIEAGGGGDTPELGMDNVGGVFLVLGAGLLVAITVGIIDFMWNIRQISIDETVRKKNIK